MTAVLYSFRRAQFGDIPPPAAGVLIASQSGRSTLLVKKVTVFRRAGESPARDTIRLQVDRLPKAARVDADVLPWPIQTAPAAPPPLPEPARFQMLAKATVAATAPRSRKQRKRDLAREAQIHMDNLESPVPAAQRHAVVDAQGTVVRAPIAVPGTWRDPEDDTAVRSRTPRMTRGFRRCDPLVVLAKANSNITLEHVTAANFYRLQYERGPDGAMPGGRDLMFCDRQFSPSMGLAEYRCDAMRAWLKTQSQLPPATQRCLAAVVLGSMPITSWAAANGQDRRYAVGGLVVMLDQLLLIFKDDVHAHLQQEHVALD